jgi:hypothetical protein
MSFADHSSGVGRVRKYAGSRAALSVAMRVGFSASKARTCSVVNVAKCAILPFHNFFRGLLQTGPDEPTSHLDDMRSFNFTAAI